MTHKSITDSTDRGFVRRIIPRFVGHFQLDPKTKWPLFEYWPGAALTILWQRDGGGPLKYRIFEFTGATTQVGQHTPQLSAEKAIAKYENQNT